MAKRKLDKDAQGFEERLAQTIHKGSTFGKNLIWLYTKHCPKYNDTATMSLIRGIVERLGEKGVRNFSGNIEIRVGAMRKGKKLAHPEKGKRHERINPSSFYSGKQLVREYPFSYSLRCKSGKIVAADQTLDTKMHDFTDVIGPDQVDTLLKYSRMLNDPKMRYKLRRPKNYDQRKDYEAKKKDLKQLLKCIPGDFKQLLLKNNVDLEAIANIDVLKVGEALAEGKWSALLWALDAGKGHTIYNWFKEKARAHQLPGDVREAWIYLNDYPHLITHEQICLLGAYEFQACTMPQKGIAGDIADELRWLANDKKAKKARKLYVRQIDLKEQHLPAKFYTGQLPEDEVPSQQMTIEQKLDDQYWTIADREGILRKYPLTQFRQEWNNKILNDLFGTEFARLMTDLYAIKEQDRKHIADTKAQGQEPTPVLGKDYAFVAGIFDRMLKGEQSGTAFNRENLVRNTCIHKAEEEFGKLYVAARVQYLSKTKSAL